MATKKRQKKIHIINNYIFIALAIVIFIAGFAIYKFYQGVQAEREKQVQKQLDKQRFEEADKNKKLVFSQLLKRTGTQPLAVEEKNICYNSEQGPFDKGRLWCQSASAAYFENEIPKTQIYNHFKDILMANNIDSSEASGGQFTGSDNLKCKLFVDNSQLATSTPYYFSDNPNSKQTIVLVCVDRAQAKHYPYIEY